MIYILVKLKVKNFDALETFERQAVKIMEKHSGKMTLAFEIARDVTGGEEFHILEFPHEEAFIAYRNDEEHKKLNEIRETAISSIEVNVSNKLKTYF